MKTKLFYFIIAIAVLLAASCSKEEESLPPAPPTNSEIIIGNWTLVETGTINRDAEITLISLPDCGLERIAFYEDGTARIFGCFEGEPLTDLLTYRINEDNIFFQSIEFPDVFIDGVIISLTENTLEFRGQYNTDGVAGYERYTK